MKKIKIGIIGCGVVGGGVFRLLEKNASLIAEKHGFEFEVKRIADLRSPAGIPAKLLTKNAQDLINDSEISIVVETIGGIHPALEFILAALKAGKSVVSANKELIAKEMANIRTLIAPDIAPNELDVFPAFTSAKSGKSGKGRSVIHGLVKMRAAHWPKQELVEKLRLLPQHISVKIDPESLL